MSDAPLVTDWIQAFGSFAAVGVAVWATVLAGRAKRAGEEAQESGREAVRWAVGVGNEGVNAQLRSEGKTVWQIDRETRSLYAFKNTGTQDVRLIGVREVVTPQGGGNDVMLLSGYEGTHISPGNTFKVTYERSIVSPAVAKVEVEWEEGARTVKQVYAIS